ncbi:GFA family protein [Altererythrobacter xixiisoli]|uniref:GFA family protein n=1 Tax=Croceibacterium xixiisoli TaxID=1476466 RepID=A0A6I4TR59_9SPHN|nr:GFA family protein [Croceibacterium xixiisoli]
MRTGGCHCGAIRYQAEGEPLHHAVCHCSDCRASSGAPMLAWYAIKQDQLQLISGEPVTFEGTPGAQRQFCGTCGTGLFYRNAEMLPGIVDIQSATFDDAASVPPGAQIQCAERLEWVSGLENLPAFDRYPGA